MGNIITDKAMQAKAGTTDKWLTEAAARGAGRFVGRITPSGERIFYFRYSLSNGKRDTLQIGNYSPVTREGCFTLKDARDKADSLRQIMRDGAQDIRSHLADQAENKRQLDEQDKRERTAAELADQRRITLQVLFEQWRLVELAPHLNSKGLRIGRKDAGRYVQQQFERHVFPTLGNIPVESLRKADVLGVLDEHRIKGQLRTANILLSDLKQMFRFAVEREIVEHSPIEHLRKNKVGGADTERDRYLEEKEILTLSQLVPLARLSKRSEHAIWLILATGCRIGELMGATWNSNADKHELIQIAEACEVKFGTVNLETREWYIPTTKNQRDHTIHLSDFAIQHFQALWELREHDAWIFPDTSAKKPVCVKSFGKQIGDRQRPTITEAGKRTVKPAMKNRTAATTALALPAGKWTAHDLRRTAATLMASLGFSADTINECLNHKQHDRMARVYIKDRRAADQARAFDALGQKLAVLLGGDTEKNVVSIKRKVA